MVDLKYKTWYNESGSYADYTALQAQVFVYTYIKLSTLCIAQLYTQ